MVINSAKLTH